MPYLYDDEDNIQMDDSCMDILIAMEKRYWDRQRQKLEEAGDINAEQQ